mgnify:CR=1 FL=1
MKRLTLLALAAAGIATALPAAAQFQKPEDEIKYRQSAMALQGATLGAVFAIFAGFYYWFAKITGYNYSEFWGKLHFFVTFIGVNIIFFPQHFLGLAGMPRRYVDYPDAYADWNYISSIGSYISAFGVVIFLIMLADAFLKKRKAEGNPWGEGATTLEWTLPSPPPFHQFNELPRIKPDHH